MRRRMAAVAVGLVLLMTGCGSAQDPTGSPDATDGAPATGDALYAAGASTHAAFAGGLHEALMTVEDGIWDVRQRDYGAVPLACGDDGYSFQAIREAHPEGVDADTLTDRMVAALEALDLDVTTDVFGSGADEERAVVGSGGVFDRVTFTLRPATGVVLMTATSTCAPGDANDLANMVFADSTARDQWRLLPATEGPDSQPQFYFPADGPVYYDESGTPLVPQPVVTELPVAPYSG